MAVPTNIGFAEEVKADRLSTLAAITGVSSGVMLIVVIIINSLVSIPTLSVNLMSGMLILLAGCIGTRLLLDRDRFQSAAWLYISGAVLAVSALLYNASPITLQIVPFFFPIIVFIAGLMVSPIGIAYLSMACVGIIFFVPMIGAEAVMVTSHTLVAIALMLVSATLAAQVTGELYQIAQWALFNYQRERRTNDELFEKREALQRSLLRSEALGDKLRETNDQLAIAHAEAEEAKDFRGQFLANMSHELRTPLNAIIGFSETMLQYPMMYDGEELPDKYKHDMEQIYGSGQQLLSVINDILDLARVDAGKLEVFMQPVEVLPIINAVESTTRGLIGQKPVQLIRNLPDPMPEVWADGKRLRQVLLNVYSNAAKYTDAGMIELTVQVTDDDMLQFALHDTGVGIAEAFHETLFEEFEQAVHKGRDPRAGAGLGLAITKQLLTLMGGQIWLDSEVGVGSTFYFTVRLNTGQSAADASQRIGVDDVTSYDENPVQEVQ